MILDLTLDPKISTKHYADDHPAFDIPKSKWGPGPWQTEPDSVTWTTTSDLPGAIFRNGLGALCGYVGVAPGHPLYGQPYAGLVEYTLEAHWGVNYADRIPACAEDLWWIGFDCCHAWDLMPAMSAALRGVRDPLGELLTAMKELIDHHHGRPRYRDHYRDIPYVFDEVEELARQVAAIQGTTKRMIGDEP